MKFEKILSPIKIGNMEVKNRFVVAPMAMSWTSGADGSPNQTAIDYYTERAKGGFGLLMLGGVALADLNMGIPMLNFGEDSVIEGFKKLTDSVHEAGAKVMCQIGHAGRQGTMIAPSAVPDPIYGPMLNMVPEEMTVEQVWDMIDDYVQAAVRVKKSGFDGVEIHGAHGYLIAQFMSGHANKRFDEFGGDFMGRMKFPLEIVKRVREACGDDYTIGFRMSANEMVSGGRTMEESPIVAKLLEEAGVDVLSISRCVYGSLQWMCPHSSVPAGFSQYDTEIIKKQVNIPVMAVGRLGTNLPLAEDIVKTGKADFICLGRSSLADPELPNKVAEGRTEEICACISCNQACISAMFEGKQVSCLANPRLGKEGVYDFKEAENKKNVMVVGSGPAGLLAGWVAAKRGHNVTVYEKESRLGGQFRVAAIPPGKFDILSMIKYNVTMGKKYGVEYKLNTEVNEELVNEVNPDAVILATGAVPAAPPIEGIDNESFLAAIDVLDGKAMPAGNRVLIAGGGAVGCETADYLGEQHRDVTIIEGRSMIAMDESMLVRPFTMEHLHERRVNLITNAMISRFTDNGVEYTLGGESIVLDGFDSVILALGAKAYNPLEEKLNGKVNEVYVIGDAVQARRADDATREAMEVASKI